MQETPAQTLGGEPAGKADEASTRLSIKPFPAPTVTLFLGYGVSNYLWHNNSTGIQIIENTLTYTSGKDCCTSEKGFVVGLLFRHVWQVLRKRYVAFDMSCNTTAPHPYALRVVVGQL